MDKKYKILIAIAATAAFVFLAYIWHRTEVEAAADKATLNSQLAQQGQAITKLLQEKDARDKVATAEKKDVDKQVGAATAGSPAQMAALIAALSGSKTPPVTITLPQAVPPGTAPAKELPSDPVGTVNRQQLAEWTTYAGACKKAEIDRDTCQADGKTKDGIIAENNKTITDLKNYNAGGTKWQRMKRAGKWILVGAASAEAARIILKGKL